MTDDTSTNDTPANDTPEKDAPAQKSAADDAPQDGASRDNASKDNVAKDNAAKDRDGGGAARSDARGDAADLPRLPLNAYRAVLMRRLEAPRAAHAARDASASDAGAADGGNDDNDDNDNDNGGNGGSYEGDNDGGASAGPMSAAPLSAVTAPASSAYPALNQQIVQAVDATNNATEAGAPTVIAASADAMISQASALAAQSSASYYDGISRLVMASQAVMLKNLTQDLAEGNDKGAVAQAVGIAVTELLLGGAMAVAAAGGAMESEAASFSISKIDKAVETLSGLAGGGAASAGGSADSAPGDA